MLPLKEYQLKKTTLEKYHLNYWEFWFTYDNVLYDEFGQSEFGYNSFHDMCLDLREDYKQNRELHKCKAICEPLCYYFARFFEWSEKENCYLYTEYKLTFRKGRIIGKVI